MHLREPVELIALSIIVIKMKLSYNWLQLEDSDYLRALSENKLLSEGKNSRRT